MGLYGNAITAIGAVAGGILGSLLTYRHNRKIEEKKNEEYRKTEELRRRAQEDEERQFNLRIMEIVQSELKFYSSVVEGALDEMNRKPMGELNKLLKIVAAYLGVYQKLSIERRAKVFSPKALPYIESAYQIFTIFPENFEIQYRRFEDGGITKKELVNVMEAHKDVIDEALKVLEEDMRAVS